MNSKEDFLEKMVDRYKSWMKDGLTAETAAFEYLKRNPYFIEVVNFFNKQIEELRDDPSLLVTGGVKMGSMKAA
ncbi:MAG: hypothetical protein U9Q40_11150 [Campylobacterota bacterium]|nr:hypothetical protein [Campylobacterota bacterium]